MRCYTVDGTGLDSLTLVDRIVTEKPERDEVKVDVHAVSLNYRDLMVADGRYSGKQDVPIIACSDMAGVVAKIGENVTEFKVGDRVLNAPFRFWPAGSLRSKWAGTFVGGAGVDGVLAEQIVYPAEALVKIPKHLTFQQASTLTIAGLTAWSAIVTHGRVKAGDWILLHGTGGVSIFGAQLARIAGAQAILTTSSLIKSKLVKEEFGVTETVDYNDSDWPDQVREITGGEGVNLVVDVAGGTTLQKSINACAPGARICLIGVLAGIESKIDTIEVIMRQLLIRGILMESTEELRAFVRACKVAELEPYIHRVFPFDEARAAYEHLKSKKHIGKIVIDVR